MATTAERRAASKATSQAGQRKARNEAAAFGAAPEPVDVTERKRHGDLDDIYAGVDAEGQAHDLGPWIETPSSSRVSRFRFDHLQRQLQVQWRNNKNNGYIYEGIDYEGYRSFARVVSKGKYINRILTHDFRPMNITEYEAPSNERRKGLGSRLST